MASSWFLIIMTFKFLHHVAWPLLALVYPMCASVQAIETDSYEETKHLISYWILLSLIYLFEYAFMSLLPWFQLWMYIKILFIFWLTIPDFGRASYVYNNLISSMKLQIVTWRSNNYWKKWFFDKDDFLMHAERYMKENGTEALEKLIASKNTMCRPDSKVTNEIIVTDDKEMLKTNGERIQIEQNDIKNLEAIEKQEILVTKQGIPVMPIIGPSPNASSATVETKGTTESDIVDGEVPQSSTSTEKEVQKEWTCALCLVTAQGEKVWNSHLSGRKHRASLQKQKEPEVTNKIITAGNKEVLEDIPVMPKIEPSQNASSATVETKGTEESDRAGGEVPQSSTSTQKEVQKQSTCALCLLTTTCEKNMTMHLNGKRHRAALQKQKDAEVTNQLIATDNKKILKTNGERLQTEDKDIKDSEIIEKKEIPSTKQDILIMPKIGLSQNASSATVETKGSDTVGGEVPLSSTSTQKQVQKQWTCALCLLTVACEKDVNSHLNGKKHRANLRSFES
ncbi:HVA22 protein [Trifolium repens]|nr:HVA22 protein [Trifolium repens]